MRKALAPRFGLVRFSIISGSQLLPDSTSSISRPTRSARRRSSSSRSNSREIRIVSSARPSVVVKICASTMLPPAAAQAPAITDSRRGWSCASTVISVTASNWRGLTMVASALAACVGLADERRHGAAGRRCRPPADSCRSAGRHSGARSASGQSASASASRSRAAAARSARDTSEKPPVSSSSVS